MLSEALVVLHGACQTLTVTDCWVRTVDWSSRSITTDTLQNTSIGCFNVSLSNRFDYTVFIREVKISILQINVLPHRDYLTPGIPTSHQLCIEGSIKQTFRKHNI